MSGDAYGPYDPQHGFVVPPMPSAPPPAPPDGRRAAAVALLNLSGLGLGYVLVRRWIGAAACWVATGILLLVALPADPDGVPGAALVGYGTVLVAAAAHGALVGLRTPLMWPPRAPVAAALGLVLLAVPAGGVVLYGNARDEAVEQMLLDRLDRADQLVAQASKQPFSSSESDYRRALNVYSGLITHHPGSRAAHRVPDRMTTYYTTVGAAYAEQQYCDAIAPLKYLRTVPHTMSKRQLGSLTGWPDQRLATSLYECAAHGLTSGGSDWAPQFGELLTTFPGSAQAAKVEPAVRSAVAAAAKDVHGGDPCSAVDRLKGLSSQIGALSANGTDAEAALGADAGRAGRTASAGGYACGVHQYEDGDFDSAMTTLKDFVDANKHDRNRARAQKIVIAAEIAKTVPAAGKKLPTTASGGSISVTIENDSPDEITVLYTGPVTGSLTLGPCGSCSTYSLSSTLSPGFQPCGGGRHYPRKTISLPPGTTYFLHKPKDDSVSTPGSDTAKLRSGYIYTECAYVTQGYGLSS